MNSLAVAIAVLLSITLCGSLGLYLQTRLAEHHTTERSRDMIGGVVGLLTLLLALVLGLLIWTAYGVYSTQQREIESIAAKALEFNLEMRHYGSEGDPAANFCATTSSRRASSSGATTVKWRSPTRLHIEAMAEHQQVF